MKQSSMKLVVTFLSTSLLAGFAIVGCVSGGTTNIYASSSEPHALLSYPASNEIGSDFFPALLQRVDGRGIQSAQRLTFRLEPGEHEIQLQPKARLIIANLPKGRNAQNVPDWFERRSIIVTLDSGKHYIFGARITGEDYADWQPVVREKPQE